MNLSPSFNLWEVAAGAGIGAGLVAATNWQPISVMLGAAFVAVITAWRARQWPVAFAVVLALWAYNSLVGPILPTDLTPAGVLAGAEAIAEGIEP